VRLTFFIGTNAARRGRTETLSFGESIVPINSTAHPPPIGLRLKGIGEVYAELAAFFRSQRNPLLSRTLIFPLFDLLPTGESPQVRHSIAGGLQS